MLIELLKRDNLAICAFSIIVVLIPLLILIIKTKALPTKTSVMELNKIGLIITISIHLLIIIPLLIIFILKIHYYNHLSNNGIREIVSIDSLKQTKGEITGDYKLKMSYEYSVDNKKYTGISIILNENDFANYSINDKIIILIDPEDNEKCVFYKKL